MGRTTDRIEQIWQLCYMSSYYKNDTVQNCAIGGVCDALWDIKGRQAGMPVYQLVGGKCREAADIYLHVGMGAQDPGKQLVENSMKLVDKGCRNLLVAMFLRDGAGTTLYGQPKFDDGSVPFDRDKETRKVLAAFATFRKEMPPEIGLGVDVHSLLDSIRASSVLQGRRAIQTILLRGSVCAGRGRPLSDRPTAMHHASGDRRTLE